MSHINNGSLLNFGVIMIVCLPILSTSMAKTQRIVGYILQKKKDKKRKTDKQTEWKKEKKQAIPNLSRTKMQTTLNAQLTNKQTIGATVCINKQIKKTKD